MDSNKAFFKRLGIAVQIVVLGNALFLAIATMYAMQTMARVFRYANF